MKILRVLSLALVAVFCVAADPGWNPADAVKQVEQDMEKALTKSSIPGSMGLITKKILCRSLLSTVSPTA
jgi:hypothetical protein